LLAKLHRIAEMGHEMVLTQGFGEDFLAHRSELQFHDLPRVVSRGPISSSVGRPLAASMKTVNSR
jgi:hypothetical protein